MKSRHLLLAVIFAATSLNAWAVDRYTIDPTHTFPSLEVPHIQGISLWRGKFNKTTGSATLDRQKKTGSVDITIETDSIDFGFDALNDHVKGPDMFDVTRYPTATYKADSVRFKGDRPSSVQGILTLRGVSRPVTLQFRSFKCIEHPMLKVEVCGADLTGQINRSDFGIDYAVDMTGSPIVKLSIQVEAIKDK